MRAFYAGLCARMRSPLDNSMSRYLQKISLRPYNETEIWVGWDLADRTGEIEGPENGWVEFAKFGEYRFGAEAQAARP